MNSRTFLVGAAAILVTVAFDSAGAGQPSSTFRHWLDHPAIDYTGRRPTDVVADLNRKLQAGTLNLTAEGPAGYLRSVLAALEVPVESQIVVFAKDSVQRAIINTTNPRALYFNDTVAVGWVRGGFIELAAQDPVQGTIFYALQRSPSSSPQFVRRNDCLSCHYSYSTAGVPGMLARSSGEFTVNHTLPLERRWGGWYVTGSHGSIRHLGNVDLDRPFPSPAPASTLNWPSFEQKFDTAGYLTPYSDVAALMVFEHQMHLMNLLARIGWEARVAAYRANRSDGAVSKDEEPISLIDAASEIVDYMLFVDEAPLVDPIKGSSGFAERFERQGPHDRAGRSLRQLDLRRRLLRYPCSYLIYSPAFDHLPEAARAAIYQRMWQVLSGEDGGPKDARLALADRRAIVEILRDTKKDLPDYFGAVTR
jgi:hypothetical protein